MFSSCPCSTLLGSSIPAAGGCKRCRCRCGVALDRNGVEHPIPSFFSRKFNSYQLNYSVVQKETLALVWALQHLVFVVYVDSGVPIYKDHKPITFLHSLPCPKRRLMHCFLFCNHTTAISYRFLRRLPVLPSLPSAL